MSDFLHKFGRGLVDKKFVNPKFEVSRLPAGSTPLLPAFYSPANLSDNLFFLC
jgi:hypothetical protein